MLSVYKTEALMEKATLGKRIRIARKEQGITSEKLSELCHIHPTYLRQIESGRKTPSLPVFIEICRQLKVSSNYLLMDYLGDNEYKDMSGITELLQTLTPGQLKVLTAMLKSGLLVIQELGEQP